MSRPARPEKRAEWRARLNRFARSESTVFDFCMAEEVSTASFYHWRAKLAGSEAASPPRPPESSPFVPVQVRAGHNASEAVLRFPSGVSLALPAHESELIDRTVAQLLASLQEDA